MKILLFILLILNYVAHSQAKDSTNINKTKLDSAVRVSEESASSQTFSKKSDIDTVVVYKALDTARFDVKSKKMFLVGEASTRYQQQHLKADNIIIDFENSLLDASGSKDSTGKLKGFPQFAEKGETYVGEKILYNFKTQQGLITLGETELTQGYYYGDKIKRVSRNEFFVKNGRYTTCDNPRPHYYFGSPKMKMIAKDKVLIDPIIFYVEDMPIFILPFGLFFPNKSGRRSGIIIPSFFFSENRGVAIQDFSVYLALSDYYDTQFGVDFYSKGGFTAKNHTRWKLRDVFDGSMDLEYGKTRFDPDNEYSTNYKFAFNHRQSLTPQSRIVADVSFMSQNYIQNTNYKSLSRRMTQDITSNASYSRSFDNGSSVSLAFNRNQNIITNEVRQTFPRLNYTLPQFQPLEAITKAGSWMPEWARNLSVSYSGSGNYYTEKVLDQDSNFVDDYRSSISHNPSISVSPKLGYFNFTPYVSFQAKNYFRRVTKSYNASDSTVSESFEKGFFTEYNYSYGVNLSTRLYGMLKPKMFDVKAVRHTLQPTLGYSFSPDLSSSDYGFYDAYYDEAQDREVRYSRYEADGGGIASRSRSESFRYSILNSFEAKINQKDTLPDKNVEFLRWNLRGSYNMAADSLKFSDVSMDFRVPALSDINLNARANFTLYDEVNGGKIDKLLIERGKGLMRLTNFNLQLSTAFSSQGVDVGTSFGQETDESETSEDSIGIGERFRRRVEYERAKKDWFGDSSPGYSPISIPWNVSLGLNYQYSEPTVGNITRRINLNAQFSFQLTQTWSFNGNAQYDFVNNELIAPSLDISKDLHCWRLSFQWWPIGYNSGFYLRFAIKAPHLSDLKIEKRSSPILR